MSARRILGAVAAVVFLVLLALQLVSRHPHAAPPRTPIGDRSPAARTVSDGPTTAEADVDGCEATSRPLPPDHRNIIATGHATATTIYAFGDHMECGYGGIGLRPHQPGRSYALAAGATALTAADPAGSGRRQRVPTTFPSG